MIALGHVLWKKCGKVCLRECQRKRELENIKKDVVGHQALEDKVKQLKEALVSEEQIVKENEESFPNVT